MRPNLFFINFNRSGDCLFVFLRYIFLGLFSFLWLEFGHYNQSENRPFFKCPLSKCAQFSGRYLSTTLYSTSKATMIYSSKRRRGKNVAEMWHFRLESATLGENRQQWTKKNGNPSLSSDSRNFGKKMVDHFFIFQKNSLHLKMANFSSLKRRSIFTSRKILREKLELHSYMPSEPHGEGDIAVELWKKLEPGEK